MPRIRAAIAYFVTFFVLTVGVVHSTRRMVDPAGVT